MSKRILSLSHLITPNHTKLSLMVLFLAISSTAVASSTWYVNGVDGSDSNNCRSPQTPCKTIGHAISLAFSGDSIVVAAATYTEDLTIGISLRIAGFGAGTTIIDGGSRGSVVTISNAAAHVTISNVTIRNGFALSGGGVVNSGELTIKNSTVSGNSATGNPAFGGGIYNSGALTIRKSTIRENTASNGLCNSIQRACAGGGILNYYGTVTIYSTTLNANTSANGGGIFSWGGRLSVNNSTVSGNSAEFAGGGIGTIFSSQSTEINNSTLSGNSVGSGGSGGAIANSLASPSTVTLQDSIVANTPFGGNCLGAVTSNGYNLSSDGTCDFNNTGDMNNTDPMLGLLQNNGGPTQTRALLSGSPAIDAGNPSGCTDSQGRLLKTDQRGYPRPDPEDSGGCDMGAYERQSD